MSDADSYNLKAELSRAGMTGGDLTRVMHLDRAIVWRWFLGELPVPRHVQNFITKAAASEKPAEGA